ncbi:MAG: putative cytochrome c [Halothiobacillaceae bacterium]|nr:MAG: putative cytochrome c [Halothiobacillaceae bacterium]
MDTLTRCSPHLVRLLAVATVWLVGGIAVAGDTELARGEMIYVKFCALCHGEQLQGQPDWRHRRVDGKLPAPPHDATGHTWHHPDEVLFAITKNGMVPPHAPDNYSSDMPAWGAILSDADIWAVLAYIKSRWPAETQKIQREIDARFRR